MSLLALHLSTLLAQFPGREEPPPAESTRYFEVIENHHEIVYPLLGLLALVLIVVGIVSAWRSEGMDGTQKAKIKQDILFELRKNLGGTSAEQIARAIGLPTLKTVKLLEEMLRDSQVISYTNTQRLQVWQVKGLGPAR